MSSARGERDAAIDILRGLALVTITINHLTGLAFKAGLEGQPFPTLSHWGFSSAAEIFFLLSGYLVGAVYLRHDRDAEIGRFTRAMLARASRLYVFNGLLFLIVLPICWLSPQLARLSFFSYFINGGLPAATSFALLYLQPYCLEILATYIVFLLAAPLFAWGLLRKPALAVAASLILYLVAYYNHALKLPGGTPAGDWRWNFSPASWQFLFFGALAAGRFRLLDRAKAVLLADRRWFVAGVALFAALTLLFVAQTALEPYGFGFYLPWQSKVRVGPIRVIHALSICWVVLGAFWLWPTAQRAWWARQVAAIGRISLQSFVASVAISYVAGLLWLEGSPTYSAYIALCLLSVTALGLFAHLHRRLSARETIQLATQAA